MCNFETLGRRFLVLGLSLFLLTLAGTGCGGGSTAGGSATSSLSGGAGATGGTISGGGSGNGPGSGGDPNSPITTAVQPPGSARNGLIVGGAMSDFAYTAEQTADGGYFISGNTMSAGSGSIDYWGIKYDAAGRQTWSQTYGGTDEDFGRAGQQTADGGYVLAGYSKSFGSGGYDAWVVKTDSAGKQSWAKSFGTAGDERGHDIRQTADGGYILAGYTTSSGAGGSDFLLMKLNAAGGLTWQRTLGGSSSEDPNSVRQTSDGGYVMTGNTSSYGAGGSDVWVVKTDSNGNQLWAKTFGGTGYDQGNSIQQTSDGGYIVAAYTSTTTAVEFDAWILKLDASGNQTWAKKFGTAGTDLAYSAKQTSDGGYVVAGKWNDDLMVMKLDSSGNQSWMKTYGGPGNDFAYCIAPTSDGGYIVAGDTDSYGNGFSAWVLKLDSYGAMSW